VNNLVHSEPFEAPFQPAREQFEDLAEILGSPGTLERTHSEVEALIQERGMELMRRLFQGHLNARGLGEAQGEVKNAEGQVYTHVRVESRRIMSVFGPVELFRTGYGRRDESPLYPRDGELNLTEDSYTFGTRKRVAVEASKNSFDETVETIRETTGANVPKRQAQELLERAVGDFDDFYKGREVMEQETSGPILVISVDGKGIVMRKEDLREATRKAAEQRTRKLKKKLTRGEKRDTKRMATVATVYTIEPHCRTPDDIVDEVRRLRRASDERPSPENKRVWASIEKSPEEVIDEAFEEACRRDPEKKRHWVALVDGNKAQIRILKELARLYGVQLTIVLDIMHVLGYLWKAAYSFHEEASKESEEWVREKLREILKGKAGYVAGGIRRSATLRRLTGSKRKAVDKCCNYILSYTDCMHYETCLSVGFPIATGVVEGACRHLINDRMDVTGARWSLKGAESVLKMRALRASGDFAQYWQYHENRELKRNHVDKYENHVPCTRKPHANGKDSRPELRLVK